MTEAELVERRYGEGSFEFAAPGDMQERTWILRFHDPDCREQYFTDEAEAWAAWNLFAPTYNCHLFETAALSRASGPEAAEAESLIRLADKCERSALFYAERAHRVGPFYNRKDVAEAANLFGVAAGILRHIETMTFMDRDHINPDGPEAAALITRLTSELEQARDALTRLLARQGWSEGRLSNGEPLPDSEVVTMLCTMGDVRSARAALAKGSSDE